MSADRPSTDRWDLLRSLTAARIGLGRAGSGIATRDHLAFQAAHALARDAVGSELDRDTLAAGVLKLGLHPCVVACAAPDQRSYLTRPDLGRRLDSASAQLLTARAASQGPASPDIVFVLAGGLSASGVARNAIPLLAELASALTRADLRIGPVCILGRGRVAIGDEIGQLLDANMVAVLIGERPGLTSPDSLGAYLTLQPHPGRTDAERNCVSNIRPEGMPYAEAARRLLWLIGAARARGLTGVALKDESGTAPGLLT